MGTETTRSKAKTKVERDQQRASGAAGQSLKFIEAILGEDVHYARVKSLADATTGALEASSLAITAMAHGLASVVDVDPEHATKQIDRLLGNSGLVLDELFVPWTRWLIGARKAITLAIDWTEFDRDHHATLSFNIVTEHGRALPFMWRTIDTLDKDIRRPAVEEEMLRRLFKLVGEDLEVTLLGDRWFGNQALYELCYELGLDFVMRFRAGITVTNRKGVAKKAADWLGDKRTVRMKDVCVTEDDCWVGQVVLKHDPAMAEPWCLASSRGDLNATEVTELYGRRFTIEECFRDLKDPRFGFGLREVRIKRTDRRDRLIFIAALTSALVTLLGAASERCGFDKKFSSKAQLKRGRVYSLFRQGLHWLRALPNLMQHNARTLLRAFEAVLREHPYASAILGLNK